MHIWVDESDVLDSIRNHLSDQWILGQLDTEEVAEFARDQLGMIDDEDADIESFSNDTLISELSSRFVSRSEVNNILSMLDINDIADFVENN